MPEQKAAKPDWHTKVRHAQHGPNQQFKIEPGSGQLKWEATRPRKDQVNSQSASLGHEGTIQRLGDWREKHEKMIAIARADLDKFLAEINK